MSSKQSTPSKGLPNQNQGLPTQTPSHQAVPNVNPYIHKTNTLSPMSSTLLTNISSPTSVDMIVESVHPNTRDERVLLSPTHSCVVAKSTSSKHEDLTSQPSNINSSHTPRHIRTSLYLTSPARSFFSPTTPDTGTANTTGDNPVQEWVNDCTTLPPPQSPPPPPPPPTPTPNTTTHTTPTPRSMPTIIVDNITIHHTQAETLTQLTTQFHGIGITKTSFLPRGGLSLTPSKPKDANTILCHEKWDLTFFGPHIYIHLAHKDLRPWYCINKIPLDMHDSVIRTAIENFRTPSGHPIDPEGIHRNTKGPLPTTLYIFKVKDSTTGQSITNTDISIDGKLFRIRKFIQSGILRCTKCQGFGHLWKGCKQPKKCVRCSGLNCEVGDCKTALRKCANCGAGHSAAMKTCPERKKQMREFYLREKTKTYTSNLNSKIMSQQKDQMDQNEFLRKRAQDLTQENNLLKARLSKLEFSQKSAINAEQLGEILTTIFRNIIPIHSPLASKGIETIIKGDIMNVMQRGNPSSPHSTIPEPPDPPNLPNSPTSSLSSTDAYLYKLVQSPPTTNTRPTTTTILDKSTINLPPNMSNLRRSSRLRSNSVGHF